MDKNNYETNKRLNAIFNRRFPEDKVRPKLSLRYFLSNSFFSVLHIIASFFIIFFSLLFLYVAFYGPFKPVNLLPRGADDTLPQYSLPVDNQ